MPNERAARLAELAKSALDLPAGERAAFLDLECAGDPALRRELDDLLGRADQPGDFLEREAFHFVAESLAGDGSGLAGQMIDHYEIESLIATGGMGEVYLARDCKLQRQVALKLVRRGLHSAESVRHFQREELLLAGLNHPNIAQLYGGGITADGVPFFAMEYVAGQRLDEYCAERRLPLRERLELFRKVCAAVGYAHQHLVIHRDLKPANIRVTAEGEPKLLDFGIAKLLETESAVPNEQTLTLAHTMTPSYASPEQINGESMTTASDIYSLGVVLYELLTGAKPYRLTTSRPAELTAAITTLAPARPSSVRRELAGDLDTILLMALRKEPERRYSSAGQLSEDLRRHLVGLPVIAHRDSAMYRCAKFVRRHRPGVVAAALLVLAILGGLIGTLREQRRAERRFNDVRQLANALLFQISPKIEKLPGAVGAREALVTESLKYLDRLDQESSDDPSLQEELAAAYEKVGDVQGENAEASLGDTAAGLASYRKAEQLRRALLRAQPKSAARRDALAHNLEQLGYSLWWADQTAQAVATYDKAFALRRALVAEFPDSVPYRRALAHLEMTAGDIPAWNDDSPAALLHFRRALGILEKLAAAAPHDDQAQSDVGSCLTRIGSTQATAGKYAEAEASYARALAKLQPIAQRNPNSYPAIRQMWFLRFSQCERFLQEPAPAKALALSPQMVSLAETLTRQDPNDFSMRHNLANSYSYSGDAHQLTGDFAGAIAEYRRAYHINSALFQRSPGDTEDIHAAALELLGIGRSQIALGQSAEALASLQQARVLLQNAAAKDPGNLSTHVDLVICEQVIGQAYAAGKDPARAHQWFENALHTLREKPSESESSVAQKKLLAELQKEIAPEKPHPVELGDR